MTIRNANPSKRIDWFDSFAGVNKYHFLSNFYEGDPLTMGQLTFATGEHMFAAFKAARRSDFEAVCRADSPGAAKHIGRLCELRSDWEAVKYDVMRAVIAVKFEPERNEGEWLLNTGNAMLVEGTDWNDRVWGIDNHTGFGRNWLGTILMARRAELAAMAHPFDYASTFDFIAPEW